MEVRLEISEIYRTASPKTFQDDERMMKTFKLQKIKNI